MMAAVQTYVDHGGVPETIRRNTPGVATPGVFLHGMTATIEKHNPKLLSYFYFAD
jgi:hypothetical protein